jgi:hypothetical protein
MSHDSRESEDNFGEGTGYYPSRREPVLGTMLPDLFAGELAAMGRLLVKMSAALSRRALAEQDVLVKCRDAANELRAQALLLAEKCTKDVEPGGRVGESFTAWMPRTQPVVLSNAAVSGLKMTCLHHLPKQRLTSLWMRGTPRDNGESMVVRVPGR